MAKKNISVNFGGYTIREIFDFNSEDLGLNLTVIIPRDAWYEIQNSELGKNLLGGISTECKKNLKDSLGSSDYKKYIFGYMEDLSENLSNRLEALQKDEIITKIVISENGTIVSYLNGNKIESTKFPKEIVEKVLLVYRSVINI